jgi:single-strand DNA-binding protein
MANLNLATNHRKKEGDEWIDATEWHRVILFGRTAEIARDYLGKGREVLIEGRIQTRSYDKQGIETYTTEIVADRLELIGGRSDNGGQRTTAPTSAPAPVADDEIPF